MGDYRDRRPVIATSEEFIKKRYPWAECRNERDLHTRYRKIRLLFNRLSRQDQNQYYVLIKGKREASNSHPRFLFCNFNWERL